MNPHSETACLSDAGANSYRAAAKALGLLVFGWFFAVLAVALALPIPRTYDFTVNNVRDTTGNVAPPFNPVVGSITVTFDPALGVIVNQITDITVPSLNVTVASPIAFSYSAANTDELQIGGLDQGTGALTTGVSDFFLDIFDASGPIPFFGNLGYTTQATTAVFAPSSRADGTVAVEPAPPVPEPATLALLLAGGLASLVIYGRRNSFCRSPIA